MSKLRAYLHALTLFSTLTCIVLLLYQRNTPVYLQIPKNEKIRSLLITGADRGIGLELVRQFLSHPFVKPETVIATAINLDETWYLQNIAEMDKRLHILELDVTKFETFKDFVNKVSDIVGEGGLNVLFNNAGILLDWHAKIDNVTVKSLLSHFTTNTLGPIMLTKALLPLVRKAAKNTPGGISAHRAALLYMSAVYGSIAINEPPRNGNRDEDEGYFGYRESKAALNIAARTIWREVTPDGIGVLMLDPGWTQTDLVGPDAPLSAYESVQGLINVILSLDEDNNGAFLTYDGAALPW